jgi:hypothetical protein
MMDIGLIPILVISVLLVLQGGLVLALIRLKIALNQQQQQIQQLKNEQQAIISGSLGLGRKLFQVKNNLSLLERYQLELQQMATNESNIEQASKLLLKGIPIEEVIETCRISRGEAELLQQMLVSSSVH